MRIVDLLSKDSILLNASPKNKAEAIDLLVDLQVKGGKITDREAYKQGILAREENGSTAVGEGIAIPHAKSASVARAAVVVLKNAEPLDWPSFDEKPVTCAIALMVPDGEAGSEHIRLLSKTGGIHGEFHREET